MSARWDDARAKRTYANECNVATGGDEFVVSFGVEQAPQAGGAGGGIEVTRRIVLTPHVAKRLAVLLDRVVREQESRFGGPAAPPASPGQERSTRGTV